MKLYDVKSYSMLPRFAQNAFTESLCAAVDELVGELALRCDALPCETSKDALGVCRDDELAQIAEDLGVIPYYPDLKRETRENLILQAKTWTRYSGTVGAIVAMVNALFDTDSTVVDDEHSDAFHYVIEVYDNYVESSETSFRRFNECLETIGHTTTTPDGFTFYYEGYSDVNTACVGGDVLVLYDTDKLCEPVGYAVFRVLSGSVDVMAAYDSDNDMYSMDGEVTWMTSAQFEAWCASNGNALPVTSYNSSLYLGDVRQHIPQSDWEWT